MLTIEDGTGVDGANSYDTLENANAYLATKGIAPVADTDMVNGFAFVNAWVYMGEPVFPLLVQAFPRTGTIVAEDKIPQRLKYAQFEVAALYRDGSDPLGPLERGGLVQSESVDVLSTSFFPDAPAETRFPGIAALLRPFLLREWGKTGGGGTIEVGRG